MAIPQIIEELAHKIRTAIYGKDVRESLASGIEKAGEIAEDARKKSDETDSRQTELETRFEQQIQNMTLEDPSSAEIVDARGGETLLRHRLDKVDAHLAQTTNEIDILENKKMDKNTSDISVLQINKNKGKLDQTYMSDEFLQQIVGDTPINATPADRSLTSEKFARKSVDGYAISDVLLNSIFEELVLDFEIGSINASDGEFVDNPGRIRSIQYIISNKSFVLFTSNGNTDYNIFTYDKNFNYLETTSWTDEPYFELPKNTITRIVLRYKNNAPITDINDIAQNIKIYTAPQTQPDLIFVFGNVYSGGGGEDRSTNRLKSIGIFKVKKDTIFSMPNGYKLSFVYYDDEGDYISGTSWVGNRYVVKSGSNIRIVIAKDDDSDLSNEYSLTVNSLSIDEADLEMTDIIKGFASWEDFVIVDDLIYGFQRSDKSGLGYYENGIGNLYIYTLDGVLLKTLKHNFGHSNTVDYNSKTDTLILGSGSGYYNLDEWIYIIKGVKHWSDLPEDTLLDLENENIQGSQITKIFVGREFGDKVNVVWGEDNFDQYNICHVISNDGQDIRKLLLGQGSNEFENGQFVSGRSSDEFNGTYKILSHWTIDRSDVVQGGCFNPANGCIYLGMGHDGLWIDKIRINDDGVEIVDRLQQKYYLPNGEPTEWDAMAGLFVKDNVIYARVRDGGVSAINKLPVF